MVGDCPGDCGRYDCVGTRSAVGDGSGPLSGDEGHAEVASGLQLQCRRGGMCTGFQLAVGHPTLQLVGGLEHDLFSPRVGMMIQSDSYFSGW